MRLRPAWSRLSLIALVACAAAAPEDDAARLTRARAQLRRGAYDSAAATFADLAASREPSIALAARRHHVRALAERGRYDDAEAAARRYRTEPRGEELLVPLGDLLRTAWAAGRSRKRLRTGGVAPHDGQPNG